IPSALTISFQRLANPNFIPTDRRSVALAQIPTSFQSSALWHDVSRSAVPQERALDVVGFLYVAIATSLCCNSNMEEVMEGILDAIFHRRAVKVFEPVEISQGLRDEILNAARHAPSSFNSQPYRFYWVGSAAKKAAVAKLCLGQRPAETA